MKEQAAPASSQSNAKEDSVVCRSRQRRRHRRATQKKTASRKGARSASVGAEECRRRQRTSAATDDTDGAGEVQKTFKVSTLSSLSPLPVQPPAVAAEGCCCRHRRPDACCDSAYSWALETGNEFNFTGVALRGEISIEFMRIYKLSWSPRGRRLPKAPFLSLVVH